PAGGLGSLLPGRPTSAIDGVARLAALAAEVACHPAPGAAPAGALPATWQGRPCVLPVVEERGRWLRVRRPQPPNGSTTWVLAADVRTTTSPFLIEVDVATARLRLFDEGELVLD